MDDSSEQGRPHLPANLETAGPIQPLDYRSSEPKRPRHGPLPAWERIAVSAIFGAILLPPFFSIFIPDEVLEVILYPADYVVAWINPTPGHAFFIGETAYLLTFGVMGMSIGFIFQYIAKLRG